MADDRGSGKIMGLRPRTWRRVSRAVQSGRIVVYLSATTIGIALAGAVVMRVSDDDAFPTIGVSFWWAIVTVTTVGYGDVVPSDALGRIVASLMMVTGVTYISFMTAVITSVLVSTEPGRLKQEAGKDAPDGPAADKIARMADKDATAEPAADESMQATLDRIEQRLDAIDQKLDG